MNHRRRPRYRRAVVLSVAGVAAVIVASFAAIALFQQGQQTAGVTTPGGTRSGGDAPSGGHSGSDLAAPGTGSGGGESSGTPDPSAPGHSTGTAWRLVPKSGAYLGAYVQPSLYTADGTIAAVRSFQQTVGAPITLVHTYHAWRSYFPDQADRYFVHSGKVLLLTWSGTPDTRQIIAGDYDALIRARAKAVKRLGRPILMEFRHEMDRPNLQWVVHGPADFIAAWDHIRAIFAQVGAANVGWVWCPTGWGFSHGRAQPYYPGDSEVDWVCADVYSTSIHQPLQAAAQPFLSWARHTHKPVMIGEFAVNGSPSAWPNWLLAAGELAKGDKQIKAMAYFDANGTDSQGRSFQYWLGDNGPALRTFGEMLSWPLFHPVLPASQ